MWCRGKCGALLLGNSQSVRDGGKGSAQLQPSLVRERPELYRGARSLGDLRYARQQAQEEDGVIGEIGEGRRGLPLMSRGKGSQGSIQNFGRAHTVM